MALAVTRKERMPKAVEERMLKSESRNAGFAHGTVLIICSGWEFGSPRSQYISLRNPSSHQTSSCLRG